MDPINQQRSVTMKKLLEFVSGLIANLDTVEGQQLAFNELSARQAEFESAYDMSRHAAGPVFTINVDQDNITVGVDINDQRVVFRFGNVYDESSGERFDVQFYVSPDLSVTHHLLT
jgi:3,4-dihydroxy-2-butanone 4-phosphate synthase